MTLRYKLNTLLIVLALGPPVLCLASWQSSLLRRLGSGWHLITKDGEVWLWNEHFQGMPPELKTTGGD
jgi:hypothetical protein